MTTAKVRIVGGGLTGILAAFEAHRLGCRDIVLHERFDGLGGKALPRQAHGLELRQERVQFGPPGDPVRRLLEGYGLAFEEFENRHGSVSPAPGGDIAITHDFGGPALPAGDLALKPIVGDSLNDRLRAYPDEIGGALARYAQWRLGAWLDEIHEDTAEALSMHRVFPLGQEIVRIAALKRSDPHSDRLYGLPASLWGRLNNLTASQPRGGLAAFFAQCRRELEAVGVTVQDGGLVSPRQLMIERGPGETLVWAADPTPLFAAVGIEAPKPSQKSLATYLFKVRYAGPVPFHMRNFTARGAVSGIHLYESRGQVLLLAECVQESSDAELRREIHRLMVSFGGASLCLGEQVAACYRPGPICRSTEAVRRLKALRATLARTMGAAFVPGAWDVADRAQRLAQVNTGLATALDSGTAAAA